MSTRLATESDVEQKLFYRFLTAPLPHGLGFPPFSIQTKPHLRRFLIDKGAKAKNYFPDYVLLAEGLPVLVAEAKRPGQDLIEAAREARLYSIEVNAEYPPGISPIQYTIVTDGALMQVYAIDSSQCLIEAPLNEDLESTPKVDELASFVCCSERGSFAHETLNKLRKNQYWKPLRRLGGTSVRNEEIRPNSFGVDLSLKYSHLFNPTTASEREFIAQNAYIGSKRRERHLEDIDKVVKASVSPTEIDATPVENSEDPREVMQAISQAKELTNQVLLIIGGVGSGKSTFVDFLRTVKLTEELRKQTLWIEIDMNFAPNDVSRIYAWTLQAAHDQLRRAYPEIDFDDLEILRKVYSQELLKFKKGPAKLFEPGSEEYNRRLADELERLISNDEASLNAMLRYCAAERGKLPIVVLDNSDRRTRDEQLLLFQVAQWLRTTFKVMVILPIRDVTYDNHRTVPPLDTAIKDFVFRIEPPQFAKVLQRRISLAFLEMTNASKGKRVLSYTLPGGSRVEYPESELGMYLLSISKSIFEHNKFVRRLIVGLAGRDLRKAMEIFLEFCKSGHISESEIFKMRRNNGHYILPYHVVSRVLLRGQRRFYRDEESFLKSVFSATRSSSIPSYLLRFGILAWLRGMLSKEGPNRVKGFHPVGDVKGALQPYGFELAEIHEQIEALLDAAIVDAEHQGESRVSDEDLIRLAPAGNVHLTLCSNLEYLATIAEDLWIYDEGLAREIADRISDPKVHYTLSNTVRTAEDIVVYLEHHAQNDILDPQSTLKQLDVDLVGELRESISDAKRVIEKRKEDQPWLTVETLLEIGEVYSGKVDGLQPYGMFVRLRDGIVGLARGVSQEEYSVGENVSVRILHIDGVRRRVGLEVVD